MCYAVFACCGFVLFFIFFGNVSFLRVWFLYGFCLLFLLMWSFFVFCHDYYHVICFVYILYVFGLVVAPCGFEPQSQGPGPCMITATLGGYDVVLCIFG